MQHEKIIVVTRQTALEELVVRFNTREQARFYIEHMGGEFGEYEAAHERYYVALGMLKAAMPDGVRVQYIDRSFLPSFSFGDRDLVVTLGQDGLVVNTAKYLAGQPLVAFNPDARRIDGVLLPFLVENAAMVLRHAVNDSLGQRRISMARAELNDGQSLHAVNDFFIGPKSHVSARYVLTVGGQSEAQSSSGIVVSTGAGSTGWLRSIVTGAAGVMSRLREGDESEVLLPRSVYQFDWESEELVFNVREPFPSRTSQAALVSGRIAPGETLEITSQMPQTGILFSDGIEEDFLEFNAGAVARIRVAEKKLNLVV